MLFVWHTGIQLNFDQYPLFCFGFGFGFFFWGVPCFLLGPFGPGPSPGKIPRLFLFLFFFDTEVVS